MTDDYALQVSYKIGQDMVNVRAKTALELGLLLDNLPHAEIANARAAFNAVSAVAPIAAPVQPAVTPQNTYLAAALGGNVVPIVSQPAPAQAQPAQAGGIQVVKDRWDNEYTAGLPGAPSCSHGVMVKKRGKSQKGGFYERWNCSGGGFPPTIRSSEACAPQYID